ncbi:MAG: hypothetical protein ABIH23_11530 [bacterium]
MQNQAQPSLFINQRSLMDPQFPGKRVSYEDWERIFPGRTKYVPTGKENPNAYAERVKDALEKQARGRQ